MPVARGAQDGRNLGRMVTVVVDDRDAVDHPPHLIATFRAAELRERRVMRSNGTPSSRPTAIGAERVLQVVPARARRG